MSRTVEIEIPFWGFYESVHDYAIDEAIESGFNYDYEKQEDIELNGKFWDSVMSADINWSEIRNAYCKAYTEAFGEEFGLDLEFVEMTSPKEYNFSTDRIFAKVPLEQINKIRKEVEAHKDYPEYIKDRFSSRSGFWSNYDSNYQHEDWTKTILDECQYEVILEFWINNISDAGEDWQEFLLEDFRSNGGMDDVVSPAVEAIEKYIKESKPKEAISDINKAIEWINSEYMGEYDMPTFAFEAVQELKQAIKKLEEV